MKKRATFRAFLMGMLFAIFVTFAAAPMPPSVIGTWKLVSSESRSSDGEVEPSLGVNPVGVLMYDANGRMSVHLMRKDRATFASDDMRRGSPEESKAALDSYVSYFGTYEIDVSGSTISHHLEGASFPNWTGTTQKRFLKLEGKRLSLSTPPIRIDGKDVQVFLIWERVN